MKYTDTESVRGHHWEYTYENGYGASIIFGKYTYGSVDGLFELAVIHDGGICYASPITSDVIGHLSFEEIATTLASIRELPTNSSCSHKKSVFCISCNGHGWSGPPWEPDSCTTCRGTGIYEE